MDGDGSPDAPGQAAGPGTGIISPWPLRASAYSFHPRADIFQGRETSTHGLEKNLGEFRIPIRIMLLTVGAIYFWEDLGFLVVCSLYLFLLFFWASGFRLRKALILGLAGGITGWFFFAKFLGVAVPLGILAF